MYLDECIGTYTTTPPWALFINHRGMTLERGFPYHNIIVEVHKIIIVIAIKNGYECAHTVTVMCWVLIQTNIM